MKKVTYTSVAVGNLRHRKKQYVLLVTGIILSMIFSSGAVFFISSYNSSVRDLRDRSFGAQDAIVYGVNYEKMTSLASQNKIYDLGIAEELGYIFNEEDEKKGTYVAAFDETAAKHYRLEPVDGRLPESRGEIALEQDAAIRLGLDDKLGESFSVTMKVCDGEDFLPDTVNKTYTLVGLLADKRLNFERMVDGLDSFTPAGIVSSAETVEAGGKVNYGFYFNLDVPHKLFRDRDWEISSYFTDVYGRQSSIGSDYVSPLVPYSGFLPGANALTGSNTLTVTLSVVLSLASCIGIVNAFNSNLSERKKQIGCYRAVGATKRQIIGIFGRESLILALVTAPVAVLVSFFGVKLIISRMENFVFIPDITVLVISAVTAVSVVMLASLIPLSRAAKCPPMLVVRNTEYNRKVRTKHIKTQKTYKPEKLLSSRSAKFSKGRIVAVSVILAVAVFAGSFGFTAVIDMTKAWESDFDYNIYSFSSNYLNGVNYGDNVKITDGLVSSLRSVPYVAEVEPHPGMNVNLLLENPTGYGKMLLIDQRHYARIYDSSAVPELTKENYPDKLSAGVLTEEDIPYAAARRGEKMNYGCESVTCSLGFLNERDIENGEYTLLDGKIDRDKLNSGEEVMLVVPKTLGVFYGKYNCGNGNTMCEAYTSRIAPGYVQKTNGKNEVTELDSAECDFRAGDTVTLSMLYDDRTDMSGEGFALGHDFDNCEETRKTVKIGAVVDGLSDYFTAGFITTRQGYDTLFGKPVIYSSLKMYLDREPTAEIDEAVTGETEFLISGLNLHFESVFAMNAQDTKDRQTLLTALVSVLILLFAVAASMINNTVTRQIRDNKRQIGTLRAVGASAKELTGVFIRQLTQMLAIGSLGGFAVYNIVYLVFYLVFRHAGQLDDMMPYVVWPALILCVLVFGVCSLNLYVQIRKQMKNSIVDNIREL